MKRVALPFFSVRQSSRRLGGSIAVGVLGGLAGLGWGLGMPSIAQAQPVAAPDGTGTVVTPDLSGTNPGNYQITGGSSSQDGANLFHSFTQFDLNSAESATFLVSPQVTNVVGRVVNPVPSVINGSIDLSGLAGTTTTANLYLLNPAGIVFGPGASVSVPGSFTATTANGLRFGTNWFSVYGTTTPTTYSQLNGTPDALAFTSTQPGSIIQAGNLSAAGSVVVAGGSVLMTGTIATNGGPVQVAAIPGERLVRLTPAGAVLSIDLPLAADLTPVTAVPFDPVSLPVLLTGADPIGATGAVTLPDGSISLIRTGSVVPAAAAGVAIVDGAIDDGANGSLSSINANVVADLRALPAVDTNGFDAVLGRLISALLATFTDDPSALDAAIADLAAADNEGIPLTPRQQAVQLAVLEFLGFDPKAIAELTIKDRQALLKLRTQGVTADDEAEFHRVLGTPADGLPGDLGNPGDLADNLGEVADGLAELGEDRSQEPGGLQGEPPALDADQVNSALTSAEWDLPSSTFKAFDQGNFDQGWGSLEQSWEGQWSRYFGKDLNSDRPRDLASVRDRLTGLAEETGSRTAIVYITLQPQQIDLIAITPEGEPIYRRVEVDRSTVLKAVEDLRSTITNPILRNGQNYLKPAQALDRLLIQPMTAALGDRKIDTLLLSLDAGLRSMPIAALHDGQKFLIQRYALGITPSLSLTDTSYKNLSQSPVLAMGASEFLSQNPLPAVPIELETIASDRRQGQFFLNADFTVQNLEAKRAGGAFPIVHLATHGEFRPGQPDKSYIQFWGQERLTLDRLRDLRLDQPPLDLLILSACRTAVGDLQAELGFAGLAVQSGAKTAIASLWYVSDEGSLALMSEFYDRLAQTRTKAEALRQAQVAMIEGRVGVRNGSLVTPGGRGDIPLPPALAPVNRDFRHPYYWAAFTAIGSPW